MSESDNQGLLSRIANSAEYSIAAALIAVCLVVGGALWWLRPQETAAPAAPLAASSAKVAAAVDESAAVNDWKQKLGEQFNAIDEQQRKRVADEDARRARQRAEEAAIAEARREAELAARARQQAEARAREQAAAKAVPAQAATLSRREAVRAEAAIDWSSCKRPAYPQLSIKRGEEGVVIAAIDVDPAGQIQQLRLTRSSGYERLDRVTTDAIRKCRFTPAREDGMARAGTAEVRMNWRLRE